MNNTAVSIAPAKLRWARQLRDREDEDQIEKQFDIGHPALLAVGKPAQKIAVLAVAGHVRSIRFAFLDVISGS
jgi:hypothetical protein